MMSRAHGVYYRFSLKGDHFAIAEDELACCYPSLSGDGSYFFTLKDGTFFRGENVQEVILGMSSRLERYRERN
ncbi:hypothetical protein [Edwardsiella tarda]|uniref:hypothetical protein n=1 Tax=Edwardsiella tarda TaxID=636 RepID=UPI00098FDAEA|nr:hypothetical protein [Edwardsiella tarda]